MSQRVVVQAEIRNKLGLHARPAMSFVDVASTFSANVTVERVANDSDSGTPAGECVDGKSIMQMMMLAATKGTLLKISVEGDDAPAAAEALKKLVESGFDEE